MVVAICGAVTENTNLHITANRRKNQNNKNIYLGKLEFELRALCLARQALYLLSHASRSTKTF
jgi:hypothetical protein